jgi:hypothetical protein
MEHLQQPVLLAIAILVPFSLLALGHKKALLGWVCVTLFVQVFDTTTITNLPAGRIVGLLYVPVAIVSVQKWLSVKPVTAWAIDFLYLVLLGIAFGFLWPWSDGFGERLFTQTSSGRSIIYLGRSVADFSLAMFVVSELSRPNSLYYLRNALVAGSTLTALFSLASLIVGVDFYHLFTGLSIDFSGLERGRGLCYEPRGLGLACVYGLILMIPFSKRALTWWGLLLVNLLGLLISGSTSALALFVAGLMGLALLMESRERLLYMRIAATFAICALVIAAAFPSRSQKTIDNVRFRLEIGDKFGDAVPENFAEAIAFHMDVFDASSFLFLMREPLYLLIGTGPGMVSLPASDHIPPGLMSSIYSETGLNSLPTHGLLLQVANGGILSLGLWLWQIVACWNAIGALCVSRVHAEEINQWKLGRLLFGLGAVAYVVQLSVSPVWAVLWAVGVAASIKVIRSGFYSQRGSAVALREHTTTQVIRT